MYTVAADWSSPIDEIALPRRVRHANRIMHLKASWHPSMKSSSSELPEPQSLFSILLSSARFPLSTLVAQGEVDSPPPCRTGDSNLDPQKRSYVAPFSRPIISCLQGFLLTATYFELIASLGWLPVLASCLHWTLFMMSQGVARSHRPESTPESSRVSSEAFRQIPLLKCPSVSLDMWGEAESVRCNTTARTTATRFGLMQFHTDSML